MLFSYTAKSKTGEFIESTIEAADRFSAAKEIRSRGSTPVSIEDKSGLTGKLSLNGAIFSRVSVSEQIIFTKNLSGMILAGLSLSRALSVLKKQTKNAKLSAVLVSLIADINTGETFSKGLSKFPEVFSKLFVSMVRAGEESGNLSSTLAHISNTYEKDLEALLNSFTTLLEPVLILLIGGVIGFIVFAMLMPVFQMDAFVD